MGANPKTLILRTIEVYNRYRSPMSIAKLVDMEKDGFIIEFEGDFCLGCGVRDHFEDFIYEFKDLNGNCRLKIKETEQVGSQSYRVHYVVEDSYSVFKLDEEALFQEFLKERSLSFKDYLASNTCTKDVIKFHFRTWLFEREPKLK